jgi:hypothetical protein
MSSSSASGDPRLSFISSVAGSDTSHILSLIGGTVVRIFVDPAAVATLSGQVLTYQLSTLLVRLFDQVELAGDESAPCHEDFRLLAGGGPFLSGIRGLLPTLRQQFEPVGPNGKTVTIVVGSGSGGERGDIYLGASGWCARFSTEEPQPVSEAQNPLGALAAGTMGAAEVFKLVFSALLTGAFPKSSYVLSLLDYGGAAAGIEPQLPGQIPFDCVLYGSGSIGCGFLLGVLATPQLQGNLTVVDNGKFDTKNPFKYALIDAEAGQKSPFKAVWAAERISAFSRGRIHGRAFVGVTEQYVAGQPHDYTIPLAISAVDTAEARLEIQDTLPQFIVNAGIDGTLAEVSVHGFGDGATCLSCLAMQKELESWDFRPIAQAVGIPPERAYELIRGNEGMTADDLECIYAAARLPAGMLATLDSFIGQPLLSLWNRVAYSEASVQSPGAAAPARVTTAFVSAFAGVLLLAEAVKRLVPDLRPYQVLNSYQQQLLGVPAGGVFTHPREANGWCLCYSAYRQAIYRAKYG